MTHGFDVPPTLWLRILWLLYKAKWRIRPLLRVFGIDRAMSWEEVIFATKLLLPSIHAYNPEIVIGIGVGGTIWAAVIAGSLHDKPFLAIDRLVERRDNTRSVRLVGPATLTGNAELIAKKRVLLVNAEVVSAQTTIEVHSLVSRLDPAAIRVAALDFSTTATRHPDYFYLKDRGRVQKPWRRVATYTNPDEPARP